YCHPAATFKNFLRAVVVADRCQQHRVRHIHAHFANTPTRVAYFASTLAGIPFSFTAHAKDLYLSTRDAIQDRVSGATFVVTCTDYNAEYLRGLVPRENWPKIHRIYHGTDLSAFGHPLNVECRKSAQTLVPVILSVGRLVPKKGMGCLVAACGRL